ncbi:MAG TPA: choice-of-anchor tandem repeat GloVer-containing protein, partial [Terriglobales bacterium]
MTNTLGNRGWAAVLVAAILMMAAAIAAPAQEREPGQLSSGAIVETLFEFDNSNGGGPVGTPVQGTDGNFYGTTFQGGVHKQGTVFKVTPQGELSTLHSFEGTDGGGPRASLVVGTDGDFYGTTSLGGGHTDGCFTSTCGTVFKITPEGALTTLYSFCAQPVCADGTGPGGLVQGSDGNFYGTTEYGGSSSCTYTCGTVFKITPAGKLTTLFSFTSSGGYNPSYLGGLVQGTDENWGAPHSSDRKSSFLRCIAAVGPVGTVKKPSVLGEVFFKPRWESAFFA